MTEDEKAQEKQNDKERKDKFRKTNKANEAKSFQEFEDLSKVDHSILNSDAFKIIKQKFDEDVSEGPEYDCDICWKTCFKRGVKKLKQENYEKHEELYNKCKKDVSKWICNSCHAKLLRGKIPSDAIVNGLDLCELVDELNSLNQLEHALLCQIMPFMSIVARHRGAQSGLKGQVVLVPTDLKKIQTVLPRCCTDDHLIAVSLKRRLSDKSSYNKQHIRPAKVNAALEWLRNNNHLYTHVVINHDWEKVSQESDPELWSMLTDETNNNGNKSLEENVPDDSDDENGENEQIHKHGIPHPTVIGNVDGPNISVEDILEIAPGEGKIPVNRNIEPNCEPLAFPNLFSTGQFHYNSERENRITPLKYFQSRVKCRDTRFAKDSRYIFFATDWVEKDAIHNSITFSQRKSKQSDITAGKLRDPEHIRKMISDDEMYAVFKQIRGTPQYFKSMQLDVLAKIRYFGVNTWFMTWSAAQFQWTHLIKIVARQTGQILSDIEIEEMDWSSKADILKRNPVMVARQIDHIFTTVWKDVVVSGLYPIGEILNFDERGEFQSRTGTKHIHSVIHIKDAPKLEDDGSTDDDVIAFIDKHVTCALPNENDHPEFYSLVKKVQTHHHTSTCRKKKGKLCRFDAPWPPAKKTTISRSNVNPDSLKDAKDTVKKVCSVLVNMTEQDLANHTLDDVLEIANVYKKDYDEALLLFKSKSNITYKRALNETMISPYNTVILATLKSNMNIQYVTGIYAVLAYLTGYLCKPEHTMGELMKKAAKDVNETGVGDKLRTIGNVFINKREISTHESIMRLLSMPFRRSNNDVIYIHTGPKEQRTRVMKPKALLDKMDDDDDDIFVVGLIEKYANRPDSLNDKCLAYFATNYRPKSSNDANVDEENTIEGYLKPVAGYIEKPIDPNTIKLKNDFGEMRKRSRPCVPRSHIVSKEKSPEEYYMRLLQLYLPWRNENELKHADGTYTSKFDEVRDEIDDTIKLYEQYDDITPEDLENAYVTSTDDEFDSSDEENDDDLAFFNPDNLDINENDIDVGGENTTCTVRNIHMGNTEFYELCSQLNEEQRFIFNFVARHSQELLHFETNDTDPPNPFHIFLSGGGGVGKSHTVNAINEYLKRVLKFKDQIIDEQPSLALCASTGTAAVRISGTTLHSAFHLMDKIVSNERMHKLKIKYRFLKTVTNDEISMTGLSAWEKFENQLRKITGKSNSVYGDVSILAVGDFFQLPPVNDRYVFSVPKYKTLGVFAPHIWKDHFFLHELTQIVRQIGDPVFAEVMSRVRTGDHTVDDIAILKALETTDTSEWPVEPITLYLTNHLASAHNNRIINSLNSEIFVIKAKDSAKDEATKRCFVDVKQSLSIRDTGNLPGCLRICIGARIMITINLDNDDHISNGSLGTVVGIRGSQNNILKGEIFVMFDDPLAGNKKKCKTGKFKGAVPIKAEAKTFPLRKKSNVTITRKQYPFIEAHAITTHKSQGATCKCMIVDFDRTCSHGNRKVPINPGQAYTAISRGEDRARIKLKNFDPKLILVNKSVVNEMERLRNGRLLRDLWNHPLENKMGCTLALLNIRSWNLHLEHFICDPVHLKYCDIFCFTETHVNDNPRITITELTETWSNVLKATQHGLALCYKNETVKFVNQFETLGKVEMMACSIEYENCSLIIAIVYRKDGISANQFMVDLIEEIDALPNDCRKIIVGDFNLDLRLQTNKDIIDLFSQQIHMQQKVTYSTHIHGGILDLVFDCNDSKGEADWMPTPFSDHFVIYYNI